MCANISQPTSAIFSTTTTTILWPFFRHHPGESVPEENFWTLWCKGRLTEADTLNIRLGATPTGLSSAHLHHHPIFFTGRINALPAAQPTVSEHWRQSVIFSKVWNFKVSISWSDTVSILVTLNDIRYYFLASTNAHCRSIRALYDLSSCQEVPTSTSARPEASTSMGHWGTCPLDFQQCIFFSKL